MKTLIKYLLNEVKNKRVLKATAMELMKHVHNANTSINNFDMLHPLVQENNSNFSEQKFSSSFSGEEFFFNDHVINGEKILPGVAYFEMAREAAMLAFDKEIGNESSILLKNIVWSHPIKIGDEESRDVTIKLVPNANGDTNFEICSLTTDEPVVHSQGAIEFGKKAPSAFVNLNELKESCSKKIISSETCYEAYQEMGFDYGPAHRGIVTLHKGQDQILAKISLPDVVKATQEQFVIHPSLLDAALQASIGLFLGEEISALPFALDKLQVLEYCPDSVWVWIRHSSNNRSNGKVQKLDFDICDETGKVCIRLQGFSSRLLDNKKDGVLEEKPLQKHDDLDISLVKEDVLTEEMVVEEVLAEEMSQDEAGHDEVTDKAIQYFKKLFSSVNKLPESRIDEYAPLEDYGIDSIMVVKLTKQLEIHFGSLSKTLFFEYQTINELTTYFVEDHIDQLIPLLDIKKEEKNTVKETKTIAKEIVIAKKNTSHRSNEIKSDKPEVTSEKQSKENNKDIAIIGVSGRYSEARNLEEFWNNLSDGKDSVREIPESRWDQTKYFDPDKNKKNKSYTKWGGFMSGVEEFDPLFFKISPLEAEKLDPQERLFLQTVYETIEDAGYTKESLGRNVGVYTGVMSAEYAFFGLEQTLKGNPTFLTGSHSSIANRASYFFNFNGPSMAIDTMCSSSLISIHLACRSIQEGECDTAIAGGVNISIHPNKYLELSHMKFMSSTGRCKSFGDGGDGYVPGDGVGAVLLKPLDKAIADGDHIYGVVKGSAVNHGGKTNGYTVPNPNLQAELIKTAFNSAGIAPGLVSYIEAHGTGTGLGDPIEIKGLSKAFGDSLAYDGICPIGSVKSNIGHCEGAAGIAGVTKVLLQMKHKQLAPSLHSKVLNDNIDFDSIPFKVQQDLTTWDRPQIKENGKIVTYPRTAGVSAYGAGGANAHIVIQEYIPAVEKEIIPVTSQDPLAIVISARNTSQLKVKAEQFLTYLKDNATDDNALMDIAYTLQVGREAMNERFATVVYSIDQLKERLQSFLSGQFKEGEIYVDQVSKNREIITDLMSDNELKRDIKSWISKGEYEKLITLWVKGLTIKWDDLYSATKTMKRISLPTYPFARDRYWALDNIDEEVFTLKKSSSKMHPLVHENTSDFSIQRFTSQFEGAEFFLSDHQVNGKKVLPGVVYLEMAREAIKKTVGVASDDFNIKLKNIIWNQPFMLDNESIPIHISLELEEDSQITFEIYADSSNETPTLFCQGKAELVLIDEQEIVNIDEIITRCSAQEFSATDCYEAFEKMGLQYGAGHRGVEKIYVSDGEVLGKLKLPDSIVDSLKEYVLHPSLMDAALQASVGFILDEDEFQSMLPFAIQGVEIIQPCAVDMWAYIRFSEGSSPGDKVQKLDIDLYDSNGKVCIKIKQFTTRVLSVESPKVVEPKKSTKSDIDALLLVPDWNSLEVDATNVEEYEREIVVFCELDNTITRDIEKETENREYIFFDSEVNAINERFESYAISLFHLLQEVLKSKPKKKVLIQVVVSPQERNQLVLEGLIGMLKTVRQEHPKVITQLIDLDGDSVLDLSNILQIERSDSSQEHIRYNVGKRTVSNWVELGDSISREMPWKEEGVYLITGGLGGLGLILAEEISRNTANPTIILTGRSLLNETKQLQIDSLVSLGAHIHYVPVDITDRESVVELMDFIASDFEKLDGIIHSAGIIQDNYILRKTVQEVQEVLAPKVSGISYLDEASMDFDLDFFIVFSSVAGATGSPGQADYATGNAFMDVYSRYRNELVRKGYRKGQSLSINWPLWKDGGMGVDVGTEEMLFESIGMAPMPSDIGLSSMYQALNSNEDQVLILAGNAKKLKQFMKIHPDQANKPIDNVIEEELSDEDNFYHDIIEKVMTGELSEFELEKVVTQ